MKKVLIFGMLTVLFLSNCTWVYNNDKIKGNGNVTTEQRTVSPFDKIKITGVFTVYLSQGDTESVKVEIDDNLQQYVDVHNSGQTLILSIKKGVDFGKTTENNIYVTLKDIDRLDISGVCTVKTQTALNCNNLELKVSGVANGELELYCDQLNVGLGGVSNLDITGKTKDFNVKKDGVGSLNAADMKAQNATVRNSGVGSVSVYASEELALNNSGVGSIKYSGDANIKSLNSQGVGRIKKVD